MKLLKEAIAKAVSKFIYKRIIYKHDYSKILQSDWKIYFVNRVIVDLMKKFRIKYYLSSFYHLQTNRFIKRFNQILCEKLIRLADETD